MTDQTILHRSRDCDPNFADPEHGKELDLRTDNDWLNDYFDNHFDPEMIEDVALNHLVGVDWIRVADLIISADTEQLEAKLGRIIIMRLKKQLADYMIREAKEAEGIYE